MEWSILRLTIEKFDVETRVKKHLQIKGGYFIYLAERRVPSGQSRFLRRFELAIRAPGSNCLGMKHQVSR